VVVRSVGWSFVHFSLFFFIIGTLKFWDLFFSYHDKRSSLLPLLVLSSVSEKSAVEVSALFVGSTWDVQII
jgi:hypothetical protein